MDSNGSAGSAGRTEAGSRRDVGRRNRLRKPTQVTETPGKRFTLHRSASEAAAASCFSMDSATLRLLQHFY